MKPSAASNNHLVRPGGGAFVSQWVCEGVGNNSSTRKVSNIVKNILSFVSLLAVSGVLGIQLVQPASAVRQAPSPAEPILVGAHADAHVSSLIERSCQNCHSLRTDWPLYSRIFPFSVLIEHDVQTARTHMNLSHWQTYDDSEKSLMLSEIGSVVRNRIMPPRRYTMIHPEAKLSESEVNEIYRWTRADRRLLNHSPEK
jgi:hypothetical protein